MPRAKEPRHERGSHSSAVRTDGRHRQHAASADRLARRLGRLRQPRRGAERARHLASARAHGVQGHQAPHRAPDRRGDRAGRRRPQRGDQLRDHRLFRQRAEDRHAARARRAVRHPGQSDLRCRPSSSASRTSSCRRSARPRTSPTISCSTICNRRRFRTSRSAARSSAPARPCARFKDTNLRAYLARNYRAPDMVLAATGAVEHGAVVAEVERRFGQFNGPAGAVAAAGDASAAAPSSRRAIWSRSISRSRWKACRRARRLLQPPGLHHHARRRHVVAAVPGGAREARPLLHDLGLPRALCRHRHVRHLCRHRRRRREGADEGRRRRDRRRRRSITEAEVNRAKAQIKVGLLMALESSGARARQLASQILTYGRPLPIEEMVARIEASRSRARAPPAPR